jgi:hypothetical protein
MPLVLAAAVNNVALIVCLVLLLAFSGYLAYDKKYTGAIYCILIYLGIGLLFATGALASLGL